MHPPLVTGLTIVRNGVRLDYPFVEAIRSALPICDEYLVVVGESDDGTREAVEAIGDPRLRIVDTHWSVHVEPKKCTLAQQTNIGMHQAQGRWCLYLQGNEVLHEDDLEHVRGLLERHAADPRVEALLFERLTFWADYDHVLVAYPDLYKYTVRAIKPHIGAYSIRDAMSFAIFDGWSTHGRYPRAVDSGRFLYRYSRVHSPETMLQVAREAVHRAGGKPPDPDWIFTSKPRDFIRPWSGGHPAVMAKRRAALGRQYDPADPRVRSKLTREEHWRRVETGLLRRFGPPRSQGQRFQLVGNFAPKRRPG